LLLLLLAELLLLELLELLLQHQLHLLLLQRRIEAYCPTHTCTQPQAATHVTASTHSCNPRCCPLHTTNPQGAAACA
jgi:hypothetical protein